MAARTGVEVLDESVDVVPEGIHGVVTSLGECCADEAEQDSTGQGRHSAVACHGLYQIDGAVDHLARRAGTR